MKPTAGDDALAYSIPQAARVISVSPTTIKKLIRDGHIAPTRVAAGRTVIRRDVLEEYLRQNTR